eukprot:TRINITY_DN38678_c0_g1_i1.p1 TRINITY_DN38678_c0_g1~~TRINITY_DN38678_c0_g1_i1.p1  ORF type:complete len:610 (+),score=116.83 TRINITY_DN38678_c0_g1_i1:51-1832(+)
MARRNGAAPNGAVKLSSLQATLDKLSLDESRHVSLIKELASKMAPVMTQTPHQKKSFADSGYVFVKTLGQGRFGCVKLAKQKATQFIDSPTSALPARRRSVNYSDSNAGFVAVRIIPRYRMSNARMVVDDMLSSVEKHSALMLQIKALRALDHPNICREIDTFEDDHNIYILMELYTGGDLLHREDGRIPERRVAHIMNQVVSAVAHAHQRGIVHQDIRPQNILYATEDPDARVVLTDWSCASFISARPEESRRNILHSEYSAPELVAEKRTDREDMWSVGALAFALLTLEFPFKEVPQADFTWGNHGQEFSPACRDFIESLLRIDPQGRMSAREALNHPWLVEEHADGNVERQRSAQKFRKDLLASFHTGHLQKLMANFAVAHLTGQALHELTEAFQAIDTNQDGTIDIEEFKAFLSDSVAKSNASGNDDAEDSEVKHFLESETHLVGLFAALDTDGSGSMQYTEFLAAASAGLMQSTPALCWEAFRAFDVDGSGTITRSELKKLVATPEIDDLLHRMKHAGNHSDLASAFAEMGGMPETSEDIMNRFDKDHNGSISFSEFMETLFGQPQMERRPSMMQRRTSLKETPRHRC